MQYYVILALLALVLVLSFMGYNGFYMTSIAALLGLRLGYVHNEKNHDEKS
jgi:hypothetical protein